MDPTLTMLSRIVSAAGHRLVVAVADPGDTPRLAEVAAGTKDIDTVDWTRLRGIIDWLELHPETTDAAIADPPPRTGDPTADNLLAAVAEKIADDTGRPRPKWTRTVPGLTTPWSPPGTPRMKATELASAPAQFLSRNLRLGAGNLWRSS